MDVVIEQADRDDLDLVVVRRLDFLRDVRGEDVEMGADFVGATRRFLTTEFDAGRLRSWIARDATGDGTCVGIVSLLLWARPPRPNDVGTRDAYIINMHVDAARQRRGIGRALLDACRESRDELGIGRFLLHTTPKGRGLYESAGFSSNPELLEWTGD